MVKGCQKGIPVLFKTKTGLGGIVMFIKAESLQVKENIYKFIPVIASCDDLSGFSNTSMNTYKKQH